MTYLPVDVIIDHKAKQKHRIETLNLLAYVGLLVLVLVTTWFFKRRRRLCVHETGLAIIYGLIMGAALRYFGLEVTVSSIRLQDHIPLTAPVDYVTIEARNLGDKAANQSHVYAYEFRGEIPASAHVEKSQISYAFVDPEVFFNIILPPIVLNAGLSLKRRHFFRNIGAIFCYAFIGTTISVAFVGSFIYGSIHFIKILFGSAYLADHFSLANCLYFGAIISPTDPIAVLAIFQELGVDVNLFALVFGESILNDAVSIVLTHSIDHFSIIYGRDPYYGLLSILVECSYNFINMFLTSCCVGIVYGIITALTTKFTKLTESPLLETSLVVLMSYSSFLTAEVIDASGIVAILFCGITQAHYTINNLSFEARERLKNLFELLTFLCETFLFLAVGVCFWQRGQTWDYSFIGIAFVAVFIARALSVYPLTVLLNLGRRNKIPCNFQHLIVWGGAARGVISYSLAAKNTVGDARRIMLSTTSVIVIVTVICVGSLVGWLLKFLRIPYGNGGGGGDKNSNHHGDPSQANISATNNPSWLVRPKRVRLSSSTTDLNGQQHLAYTPSICSKYAGRHCRGHHSSDTTPVLEIETVRQYYQVGDNDEATMADLGSQASLTTNQHLAPLPEVDPAGRQQPSGARGNGESTTSDSVATLNHTKPTDDDGLSDTNQAAGVDHQNDFRPPYENASLVRRWRNLDNNFIKPLLTNSQPTLMETMPTSLRALARLFTSDEQMMRRH